MEEMEKMIIGGWLLGCHLEDVKKVYPDDFHYYGNIVAIMKRGCLDPFEISKQIAFPVAELTKFTELYAETFYTQAMKSILKNQVIEILAGMNPDDDIKEVYDYISEYQSYGVQETLPDPFKNFGSEYIAELDRREKEEVVTTGFPKLDKLLCGIKRKELTTIAARPSTGKSALALQLAVRIANQGKKVLFFPLEMSALATVERMVLSTCDINQSAIRTGKLQRPDWEKVNNACIEISEIEEGGMFKIYEGVNDFRIIEKLVQKEKPFCIIIDQLEQMRCSSEKFYDKRQRFSFMTNNFKRLSMAEDISVILLAQLRRDSSNGEPTLESLKESGSIEEDSDNVLLLHRYRPDEMNNPAEWGERNRPIKFDLAKQRSGATGQLLTVFISDKLTFYERANQ